MPTTWAVMNCSVPASGESSSAGVAGTGAAWGTPEASWLGSGHSSSISTPSVRIRSDCGARSSPASRPRALSRTLFSTAAGSAGLTVSNASDRCSRAVVSLVVIARPPQVHQVGAETPELLVPQGDQPPRVVLRQLLQRADQRVVHVLGGSQVVGVRATGWLRHDAVHDPLGEQLPGVHVQGLSGPRCRRRVVPQDRGAPF